MLLKTVLFIHVATALVGLLSGFTAMAFRKGSGLHAAAGTVFFVSMLTASAAGSCVALFLRPNSANTMGSVLTFYLVITAWVAAKRRDGKSGLFDLGALLFVSAIAAAGAIWGLQATGSPNGSKDGYPAYFFFIFGSIALMFAISDVRMLVRGGVFGAKRIARHLWRMCAALLFTSLSSQGRIFPQSLRHTLLPNVPTFLVIGAMIFWLVRVSFRKRPPHVDTTTAAYGNAIASGAVGAAGPA